MTIAQVSNKLYDLSVGGYFNGQKFTKTDLTVYISKMFRNPENLKIKNTLVMQIALPDGQWFFTISFIDGYGYDFCIPETRKFESILLKELVA